MTKRKNPKDFKPDGRPTKYRKEFDVLAYRYALLGATDKQMAVFFEVTEKTLNNWKHDHLEFLQSITRGKGLADSKVAESLYRRALGYTHSENKIFQYKGKPIVVPTTKHYPPDTQAASLWLRNRQPDKWRDQKDIVVKPGETDLRTTQEIIDGIAKREEQIANLQAQL